MRVIVVFGIIFFDYAAAAQSHNLYTNEQLLKILYDSKNYERKLEQHIKLQENLITVLKNQLSQGQQSGAQTEVSRDRNVGA